MSLHFHTLRVKSVVPDTDEAVIVSFDVPADLADTFRFTHGQHLTLREKIDGAEQRRSYSICAGVDDGELRVGIRKVPGGRFSTWAFETLRPGATIDVLPPDGRFFVPLDPRRARHHVAFAAGSGITPVLSLARTTLAAEPASRFTLFYGNRSLASTMFLEALQDLKDTCLSRLALFHLFSREPQELELFHGRLDRDRAARLLQAFVPPASIDEAYVCGPSSMIDEVCAALRDHGVDARHVHAERFGSAEGAEGSAGSAASAGLPAAAQASRAAEVPGAADAAVEVLVDGVRRRFDYRAAHGSILAAGRAAGLELPYSCAGGMCCTCRARLLEGRVEMRRNFALDAADVRDGWVLTCQAVPLTPQVRLSLDER